MSNDDQNKNKKKKKSDAGNDGDKAATKTEERTVLTVVLKIIDIHCEGCATKVKKSIRATEGVESVRGGSSKLTVVGEVDPEKLREMVEEKAKTKVEVVSSVATKVKVEVKSEEPAVAVVKTKDKKKSDEKQPEKKPDKKKKPEEDKKSKEVTKPAATTVVMKVDLHCDGCVQKIRKTVSKTKGYQEMSIDEKNNTVTVKGTMDMKALSESLQNQLHKPVEIVPPKKEKTEEKTKGGNKKEANDTIENFAALLEQNRIQYGHLNLNPNPAMYGHEFVNPTGQYHAPQMFNAQFHAPPMFSGQVHAPQMFSDENPNACYIM